VFISSPGDVADLRSATDVAIKKLNQLLGARLGVLIETVRWEIDVSPAMGRPQEVINEQARIADCDIFIGLLWARFGTPPGPDGTGKASYASGTEEEFHIAYNSWQRVKSPRILFYRRVDFSGDLSRLDLQQLAKVEGFFSQFASTGGHPGLVKHLGSAAEFEATIEKDILDVVEELVRQRVPDRDALTLADPFASMGVKELFLPAHNHFREDAKRSLLRGARDMTLVANSGHSYLALVGHRYRTELHERLGDGAKLDVVMANPWSPTGLAIASQEAPDLGEGLFVGGTSRSRVEEIIETSKWMSIKFRDALAGLGDLAGAFPAQVTAAFSFFPMSATVLLTESGGFFEPYTHTGTADRFKAGMLVAELSFSSESHLYGLSKGYVRTLQRHALSMSEFLRDQADIKKRYLATFPV
jgi:hypothetical protein